MTEPSQYFKGRTVQEQMNEVIGYVDARAEEVAAAKADDVLEPAEQAKTDAIAAKEAAEDAQQAAEDARDVTLGALSTKVDKLTTAGNRAYTHNGSTQGDTEIVDGTTAATIPIRDANGRMQAADPANGATDKTLVTANWVSQTGNSAPNNLAHRNADETIYGVKNMVDYISQTPIDTYPDIQKHSKVIPDNTNYITMMRELTFDHNDNWLGLTEIAHTGADDKLRLAFNLFRNGKTCQLRIDVDVDGNGHLYFYDGTTEHLIV